MGNGYGVFVGFTANSAYLTTTGDSTVDAWDMPDHLLLFHSYPTGVGGISPNASELVTASSAGVDVYPCQLCGGLPHLLALAHALKVKTGGFTPSEKATYLTQG